MRLRSFKKKHNGINLRIVGDGGEEKKILSLIHTLTLHDCVTLAPWTENVPSEMARADVFLLASKHEAYALTLVEALATGTPVVTTNVGCVGELVIDGVHGVVVTETGVLAYMTGMKKMITDEAFRKSCGKNGKEAVRKLMHVSPHAYARAWVTSLSQT